MKKILMSLFLIAVLAFPSYASVGFKDNGTDVGQAMDVNISGSALPRFDGSTLTLARLGYGTGSVASQATAIASGETTIGSTQLAYGLLTKTVSGSAEAGALANGTPGQLLTIVCVALTGGGTYTCTPATKTGYSAFEFTAVRQSITLLYLNNAVGWIIVGNNGSTLS